MAQDPDGDMCDECKKETEEQSAGLQEKGGYKTALEALQDVGNAYNAWSGRLTDTSLQMCYGLIAANWLVFGSVGGVLGSGWAILSLLMVMSALTLNLTGAYAMSELLRLRYDYAETDSPRWVAEFEKYAGRRNPWPFTQVIEVSGVILRLMKLVLPVVGGLFLIAGAFSKDKGL